MKRLALLALMMVAAACQHVAQQQPVTAASTSAPAPIHVVVVATTDVHGWFHGHDEQLPGRDTVVHWGGMDVLSGYVANLKAANEGRVLLVDAGDLFQGTLASNLSEGEVVVRAYNALGYTASAIGNHEFDYGPVGKSAVPRTPSEDPLGALKRNIELASFKFLGANIREKATGERPAWAPAYTMVNIGGAKIGIIGVSTPDTPVVTAPANVAGLEFLDPLNDTVQSAKELRSQGADAVIVLAHLGGMCRSTSDPYDLTACDQNSDSFKFVRDLPPGLVDAVFAGHTHKEQRVFVNGVPLVQAAAMGKAFSTVDLWIDPAAHHVTGMKTQIRPMTMICSEVFSGTEQCDGRSAPKTGPIEMVRRVYENRPVYADQAIANIFTPYEEKVETKRREPLGVRTTATFTRDYGHQSTLGNLVADALLRAVPGADFAIVNSGGLRADLRGPTVTYGDLFEVLPFDNFLATVKLTGKQVRDLIRAGSSGRQGIMQVSGLKVVVDASKGLNEPAETRDRLVSVTLPNGQPLDDQHVYTMVMNDFLSAGGDNLSIVTKTLPPSAINVFYDRLIRDTVIDQLKMIGKDKPLTPYVDDRLKIINESDLTANGGKSE